MAKHTEGPWFVQNLEPSTIGHDWVDGPNRRFIAVCHEIVGNGPYGFGQRVDADEVAANAHLIAAAPDLLAALQTVLYLFCCLTSGEDAAAAKARDMAVAAIAKAEGKA